jgi:hypothetical protein
MMEKDFDINYVPGIDQPSPEMRTAARTGGGSQVANFALRSSAILLDAMQMDRMDIQHEEGWRHWPREVLPSY